MLAIVFGRAETEGFVLPADVQEWLWRRASGPVAGSADTMVLRAVRVLQISYVGQIGADEYLMRLSEGDENSQADLLKERLSLTLREAEVLLWIARGKSNRDIGEILSLSPRTLNKHLEHIYIKLGAENRSAAAAISVRILDER